jgi:hypothetical protein
VDSKSQHHFEIQKRTNKRASTHPDLPPHFDRKQNLRSARAQSRYRPAIPLQDHRRHQHNTAYDQLRLRWILSHHMRTRKRFRTSHCRVECLDSGDVCVVILDSFALNSNSTGGSATMLTFEIDALRIRIFGIVRAAPPRLPCSSTRSPHNGVYWGWLRFGASGNSGSVGGINANNKHSRA